jgi:hypothetical protein
MTNDDAWRTTKQALPVGTHVRGRIKEHHPFGVLTAILDIPFDGLIQITDFKDAGRMTPSEYPPVGSEVEAVVLGFKEHGRQIWLGVKGSQLSMRHGADASGVGRDVIPLGLRVTEGTGFQFFGIAEINSRLKRGAAVVAIEEGKAIMIKAGETDDTVRLRLGGFSVNVILEESPGRERSP